MFSFKPARNLRPLLIEPKQPYIHRDLSWIQFNTRVLAEVNLETNPLLERIKFLSISSSNLDEFFMIRMASLGRSIATELRRGDQKQLRRLRRVRSVILGSLKQYLKYQAEALDLLVTQLLPVGIHVVIDPKESEEAFSLGKKIFDEQVLPTLFPPEPYSVSQINLMDNLQLAVFFDSGTFMKVPKKMKSVFVESMTSQNEVYLFFLDKLLETYLIPALGLQGSALVLRLTRDADLSVDLEEEDPESIPDVVLSHLNKRERGRPVRVQYKGNVDKHRLEFFQNTLKLTPQQIFEMPRTLCLNGLWSVLNEIPENIRTKAGVQYLPLQARIPREFQVVNDIFETLKKRDFLLHHPYDSFDAYVDWIRTACADLQVTRIQQTVYRMDALSPVVDILKSAAKHKKVRVVIELRARFDEFNNLRLADELRKAGVEVVFGFGKVKLHAKVALIERIENGITRLYTHLSTGNYHSITARQYTDLAILTANPEIGQDALHFFDAVGEGKIPHAFKMLVPAPAKLHRKIIHLIETEILAAKEGKKARIVAKVNTLVDPVVIEKLYFASNAGVKIDLIVRGACSLVPAVKGLSENIRVFSIVDRFLEHSRIYYFTSSNALYLSSADWMPRNFFSRLELAFPVLDSQIHQYITTVLLPAYLDDHVKARELTSDGIWKKRTLSLEKTALRSQFYFEELSNNEYQGTPLAQRTDSYSPRPS